jgi:hypothetical protein
MNKQQQDDEMDHSKPYKKRQDLSLSEKILSFEYISKINKDI